MAEKLSIQIALNGGAEIERQLEGIGQAGTKAFADITKAAEQAGGFKQLNPKDVTSKLQEMGVTGADSIKKIQDAVQSAVRLETLVRAISAVETGLKTLAAAAIPVGVAIGVAMVAATKATISFANSITKISAEAISLGASFEQFDQARKVLEGLGLSGQAVSTAFAQVQSNVEKVNLDKVKQDAAELQRSIAGGFSAPDSFKRLQEQAEHFTEAGKAARAELVKMDQPIAGVAANDIREIGVELAKLKSVGIDIKVGDDAVTQLQKITAALRQMPDSAQRTEIALQFLGKPAGTELIQQLKALEGSLPPIEAKAVTLSGAINQMGSAFARLGTVSFAPVVTAEVKAVTAALQSLQSLIENFSWETFKSAAFSAGDALKYFTIQGQVALGLKWAWDLSGFDALADKLANATRALLEWLGLAEKAGGTPLAGGAPIGGAGGGIGSHAGGGLLGGRGTGMSDSNLAWVSRGEHIMPARAVAQPGVLAFLEALRRSGGNLSRVLDGMGRFALGGMVPRAIPAFAAGGLAGGMSNVTIQFPGLPDISGLRASSDVVDQLHRAAAQAQVRSGGRKPSRYS